MSVQFCNEISGGVVAKEHITDQLHAILFIFKLYVTRKAPEHQLVHKILFKKIACW